MNNDLIRKITQAIESVGYADGESNAHWVRYAGGQIYDVKNTLRDINDNLGRIARALERQQ